MYTHKKKFLNINLTNVIFSILAEYFLCLNHMEKIKKIKHSQKQQPHQTNLSFYQKKNFF